LEINKTVIVASSWSSIFILPTRFVLNDLFFFENRAVYVEKYDTAGQAADGSMARVHCILDT
jgi:hypothetical protein